MIELVTSANGDKVIRYQGRLLGSRFEPRIEAQEWVAARLEFLDSVKTVFVLGLGSGYHVHELLKHTSAKIIVLEVNPEIVDAVQSYLTLDTQRVQIEVVGSSRDLRALSTVKAAVAQSFVVLTCPSAIVGHSESYEEMRAQLLGRDWGSLNWQWKMRNAPEVDRIPRIDAGDQPLTIHDLDQTELVQNSEERERILLKALRELVK